MSIQAAQSQIQFLEKGLTTLTHSPQNKPPYTPSFPQKPVPRLCSCKSLELWATCCGFPDSLRSQISTLTSHSENITQKDGNEKQTRTCGLCTTRLLDMISKFTYAMLNMQI